MVSIKLKCAFCGKKYFRTVRCYNEAIKFGWRQYCSLECQYRARTTQVTRKCGNPNCDNKVYRLLNQYKKSKSGLIFCSASCGAVVNNSKRKVKHGGYQKRKKKCPFCARNFFGITKYCSVECYADFLRSRPRVIKISKQKVIKAVKEFYKKQGRIPLKREFPHYNVARDRFGTWNKAVQAAGFSSNPVLFAEKQIAKDGHKCDSIAEKIIDDWLYVNRIKHKREVYYPENKSLRADFVTGKYWIEFFGLAGYLKDYDKIMRKKFLIAQRHNLPLIAIYPKDLFPENRLREIIKV